MWFIIFYIKNLGSFKKKEINSRLRGKILNESFYFYKRYKEISNK